MKVRAALLEEFGRPLVVTELDLAAPGPGEVLVSSTVRDLIVGSDQVLADRGEHQLKGIIGSWLVFAVET